MSYTFTCLNLWDGGKLFEPIVNFLQTTDSDIIALQEALKLPETGIATPLPTITDLNVRLRYSYYDFATAMIDKFPEGDMLNGNAVLSKLPIIDSKVSFFYGTSGEERHPYNAATFATTPRNLQHTVIDTPDGAINLFNFQGVWDLDGDNDSPQRRKMVAHLMNATRRIEHVIIAGDTNARPTNPAMEPLGEAFTNVFNRELTTTFNMRRKDDPGYATSVVDMIYVSQDIEVVSYNCPDVDVSDHLPLTMAFNLR